MNSQDIFSKIGFNFEYSYLNLGNAFYSLVKPEKPSNPKLILLNKNLAMNLGLNLDRVSKSTLTKLFSGEILDDDMKTFSQSYSGHQFGQFTKLGDGRAIILGEHKVGTKRYDIQFKGSGLTPYSRNGDGKGPLNAMIREYIVSESMNFLGVPTTRSLAVVETGQPVIREEIHPGAILTRVANSHIRIGTFQHISFNFSNKDLQDLFNYVMDRNFSNQNKDVLLFFEEVMNRNIDLVVNWMRIGFIHGVMNTDNILVSGETIDYGPCAFMDEYDPDKVYSYIDQAGRYRFKNQPYILKWNLGRFAESLYPLLKQDFSSNEIYSKFNFILSKFDLKFEMKWLEMMRAKIGLRLNRDSDLDLINEFLQILYQNKLDYTNSFRSLSLFLREKNNPDFLPKNCQEWSFKWLKRLRLEKKSIKDVISLMEKNNPLIIPRNHIIEEIILEIYEKKFNLYEEYMAYISNPYKTCSNKKLTSLPLNENRVKNTFCGT